MRSNRRHKISTDPRHPPSLMDFIVVAIEEAIPGVDGREVYMRAFERFTRYCEDRRRRVDNLPERVRRPV